MLNFQKKTHSRNQLIVKFFVKKKLTNKNKVNIC